MALTSAQEATIAQIITAYENGKRLADLPEVSSSSNPFDLICEVLDKTGESKKAALASMLPYMEESCSYGVVIDTAVSSPVLTRVGNTDLHKSLPIQSRMRGCLLDDNGKVVEYLDPNDWTGNTRDGSRGQVMVEIPAHYRKHTTSGTKQITRISEFPLPGYTYIPLMYVSAYEAALDRTNGKLASVVNTTVQYRGGNNDSSKDGLYNSLLGMPATVISRGSFRSYARKRNNSATTEWNCYTYDVHKAIYWLYTIEYANLNSQAGYNAALTSDGFKQGGLGAGVSEMSNWDKWGYYPIVPCGATDSLGNRTGVVAYKVLNSDGTTHYTPNVPRYRGIENPFGHIWKWTDGINIEINPTEANGGNNLSRVFVCSDPSKFTDGGYTGYSHVGNEARSEGYATKLIFGEGGEIVPSAVGGGATTYLCDYHYTAIPTATQLRGVVLGGDATHGSKDGLACVDSNSVPSSSHSFFGSRLCFIPVTA